MNTVLFVNPTIGVSENLLVVNKQGVRTECSSVI